MAKDPVCLVCQVAMEPGFLTDVGHMTIHLPRWCPGEPKASFWSGEVKTGQAKEGLRVVAFRCPTCEALRLYASSAES